jgi:hypothetical protein
MHSLPGLWTFQDLLQKTLQLRQMRKSHDSQTCTKPKDTPSTCAACNGNHPANYKGRTVYRDLKAKRSPQRPAERTTIKTSTNNPASSPQIIIYIYYISYLIFMTHTFWCNIQLHSNVVNNNCTLSANAIVSFV